MAPSFVPGTPGVTPGGVDIIVVGQKSGVLRALSASTGKTLWATQTSPGAAEGGLSWGIAVDATQAYFTAINSAQTPWTPFGTKQNITWSGFGAAKLLTGGLVWETSATYESTAFSPPSVVGDVVLVARSNNASVTSGGLVALNKKTGKIVLDQDVDATLHGGISVQDEYVFFGTGYSQGLNPTGGVGSFNVFKVVTKH
jgi:outer membrane protein assembly factor BamB